MTEQPDNQPESTPGLSPATDEAAPPRPPDPEPDVLNMWVVYYQPTLPDPWRARRWLCTAPEPTATEDIRWADTLGALRAQLPPGLYGQRRDERDHADIYEVWF